ncbi:MAG: hypothetical protein M3373_11665 [Gemmatimonadota bacterium]|nr:hypothetical protein [Gemmatimonadota bacterium]
MTDEERDQELMREAARTYRVPPEPPLDAMWQRIEAIHFGTQSRAHAVRIPIWARSIAALAAAVMLGVAIGRYALPPQHDATAAQDTARAASSVAVGGLASEVAGPEAMAGGPRSSDAPYEVATNLYLGQMAALLIALPAEVRDGHANTRFVGQAGELLSTTRLLLDSPAAADPELRILLDDLELVLAQIARLRAAQGTDELDLITGTLEQRDVLPRLRSVVANASMDN